MSIQINSSAKLFQLWVFQFLLSAFDLFLGQNNSLTCIRNRERIYVRFQISCIQINTVGLRSLFGRSISFWGIQFIDSFIQFHGFRMFVCVVCACLYFLSLSLYLCMSLSVCKIHTCIGLMCHTFSFCLWDFLLPHIQSHQISQLFTFCMMFTMTVWLLYNFFVCFYQCSFLYILEGLF